MPESAHPSLTVFESSNDRLDLQVLDLTRGIILLGLILGLFLVGFWLFFSKAIFAAIFSFTVAFNLIPAFLFLVGAKRLIADVKDDSLRVTYRAPLRRTQIDMRLSEIRQFELIDQNGNATTTPSEIKPERRETKEKYLVQAQFDDRAPVALFERAGALGRDVGQILLEWWNENSRRLRR